jgi:hypothetical protein
MEIIQHSKNLVDSILDQYIVRPTGGEFSNGVNGFVFDVLGDEEMILDSEITDHYVEENYAIQDHIARHPERFVLRGYVAELTDLFSFSALSILTNIQSLSSIGGFLPEFSEQATEAYAKIADVVSKVGEVINQARNVFDMFSNFDTSATKQQRAYNYFYTLWLSNTLCTVETPYGILTDMAIESVRALQRSETRFVSDFTVTFKKIRVTSTISFSQYPEGSGRWLEMLSGVQNNGQTAGQSVDDLGNTIVIGDLKSSFNVWEASVFDL